ncbi:MAG: PIN domain-containing protein [bacterium]|nr:PIN domain-containing protein [bacterium]
MPAYLLDSNIVIDALNNKRGRRELLQGLLLDNNLLGYCPINLTEIYAGLREPEEETAEKLLNGLNFYALTWDIAKKAGILKNQWMKKGKTLSVPDVTIAAVAIANDLILITDNLKDYPMPELKIYDNI